MTVETSKVEQSLETIDKDAAETVKGAAVAPFAATSEWLDRLFPSADAQARQLLSAAYSHYAASDHGLAASAEERGTRLTALRIELARLGLDGFLVPRTDEYLGQYVSLRAMRLHWLTGYSGSNGVAVVLKDRAVILADGRYTLQLSQQIDPRLFEQVDSDRTPLHTWLADNLPKESSLGYDPWLHSASELERLSRACKLTQSQVRRVHRNPIDSLWHDQPPEPLGAIVPHPVSYAGMSSADKRRELASELRADAAVISAAESVAWLLNIRGADAGFVPLPLSRAILHIDGRVDWFVDRRKLTPEVEPLLDRSVKVHAPEALSQVLGDLGQRRARVRLCPESAPAWIHDHLTDAGADLRHAPDPCALPRACKNAVEVQGARNASVRDGAAMVRFLAMMAREAPNGGLTEMEAAQRLLAIRREMPLFRGPSINTISSTGPNGAVIHYRVNATTNRLIESGSLYLVDSGGQYLDGTTDLTRTVAVGTPSLEQRRRFTLVLKGHIALAQLRFPRGTAGTHIDAFSRQFLWREGLDFGHGTGHGVGSYLGVHEGPQRISKAANLVPLMPGMIVSNEPGYYKPGHYGMRFENLMVVQIADDLPESDQDILCFETLSLAPIDRALLERTLLTEEEAGWVDAYHCRVKELIGPWLSDTDTNWLNEATRPLSA